MNHKYSSNTLKRFSERKTNIRPVRLYRGKSVKLMSVKLPEAVIEGADELVRRGNYHSRSAVLRAAVRDLLKKELWEAKQVSSQHAQSSR